MMIPLRCYKKIARPAELSDALRTHYYR